MEKLAHPGDVVTVLPEQLRQGHHLGHGVPKHDAILSNARLRRVKSSQKTRARRTTERVLTMGLVEADSFRGKRVEIWGRCQGISITSKHADSNRPQPTAGHSSGIEMLLSLGAHETMNPNATTDNNLHAD